MKRSILVLALLLLPSALAAQTEEDPRPFYVPNLRIEASNQRIDLAWDPARDPNASAPSVAGYRVFVYDGPTLLLTRDTNETRASFLVTNGRTYAVQVAAVLDDGSEGPRSYPVAATPALGRDMEYLAAGLVVTWLGILGYVGLLARHEARLDRKLEQLLAHRGGRNP